MHILLLYCVDFYESISIHGTQHFQFSSHFKFAPSISNFSLAQINIFQIFILDGLFPFQISYQNASTLRSPTILNTI